MSSNAKSNKATALAMLQALIAGTQKHAPSGSFTLGGATYAATTLIQEFESLVNAIGAADAARVRAKDAVQTKKATQAKVLPLARDYKRFLQLSAGTAGTELADYGLQPVKARKPLTSEQRVVARVKAKATRQARGTTSKKQKLAVTGDVTNVSITPVKVAPVLDTQTAAPAGPATPHANAPSVAVK